MRRYPFPVTSWLVLACGLAITAALWHASARQLDHEATQRFAGEARDISMAIERQTQHQVSLLLAIRGFFEASQDVSRVDFHRFLRSVDLRTHFPGLQAVQYARRFGAVDRDEFELAIRGDLSLDLRGYPQVRVHPDGPLDEHVAIEFNEPMLGNEHWLGFDLLAEPRWRETLERSRENGLPAVSQPLELRFAGENRPAVLIQVPLYRTDSHPGTMSERRRTHIGQIVGLYDLEPLFLSAVPDSSLTRIALRIEDLGPSASGSFGGGAPKALYETTRYADNVAEAAAGGAATRALRRDALLPVGGRLWRVQAIEIAPAGHLQRMPLTVLSGGLLVTTLLFVMFVLLGRRHETARSLAMRLSHEARDREERMRAVLDSAGDGIVTTDDAGCIETVNPAAERMFGWPAGAAAGQPLELFLQEDDRPRLAALRAQMLARDGAGRTSFEATGLTRGGRRFPLEIALSAVAGSGGRRVVALLHDLSERRRSARLLDQANALRRAVFESAALAIVATDANGVIEAMNPAAERMLGYREKEMRARFAIDFLHDAKELAAYAATMAAIGDAPPGASAAEVLLARARQAGSEDREWTYLRKDGSRVPVRQSVTAMRDAQGAISGYVVVAQDVSEQKRNEAHIRRLAHYDTLTSLPNRTLLGERLNHALVRASESQARVGILLVDLDRFKVINDSLGHAAGDELLRQVAKRLLACVRNGDTVARMGGDEFVIVLADLESAATAHEIAERVIEALGQPIDVGGTELRTTASVGVSVFPDDGADAALLLRNADSAMYRAKDAGRNAFRAFTAGMRGSSLPRLEIERDMYHALDRDEFVLHYQPQIDLCSGRVIGAEALLRWRRNGALVSPAEFIPIAEENGLIVPIGDWALATACRQMSAWNAAHGLELTISVNVSPRQFHDPGLIERVRGVLADTGVDPGRVELEITEGVLMQNERATLDALDGLRRLGLRLSLDDFGTGYSSLAYLKRFRIDKLKIDRAFVSGAPDDASDAALMRAIIVMSHSLDIRVVAEGVETAAQLEFARRHRCDQAQGYLFGRPMPACEFARVIIAPAEPGRAVLPGFALV